MAKKQRKQSLKSKLLKRRRSLAPTIGYFAISGSNVICDGDGCIITGTVDEMKAILRFHGCVTEDYDIRATTFAEIHRGLTLGAAYCFNELSYARFLVPARAAGMQLGDEDFSDPGPTGIHLVRIELLD